VSKDSSPRQLSSTPSPSSSPTAYRGDSKAAKAEDRVAAVPDSTVSSRNAGGDGSGTTAALASVVSARPTPGSLTLTFEPSRDRPREYFDLEDLKAVDHDPTIQPGSALVNMVGRIFERGGNPLSVATYNKGALLPCKRSSANRTQSQARHTHAHTH